MSENTQDQSVTETPAQPSEEQQEKQPEWTAEQLAQRLSKANSEAKDFRKKLQEEKRKNDDLQKKSLAEQGQFKELAEVWQRKATEAESYANKVKEAFAMKSITDTVAFEAQKLGCVDPEALSNLINLSELPLDDNFNVDKTHVKAVLEDMKKKKPYFFKQIAPKITDAIPARVEEPRLDLNKMSIAERAALLSQLKKQGK
jgi:hypothetical protein